MKFGVHNHYNNNSASIGDYKDAQFGFAIISEASVRMTDQGMVIFNLHKSLYDLDRKLAVAAELDKRLRQEFGTGLSLATSGASDCIIEGELKPFFNGIKEISPDITTIYATHRHGDNKWGRFPEGLVVDHTVEARRSVAPEIVKIVSPTAADKAQPAEGWAAFREKLNSLLAESIEATVPKRQNPELEIFPKGRHPT